MKLLGTLFALLLAGPGLGVAWILGKAFGWDTGLGADGIDTRTALIVTLTLLFEVMLALLALWWWGFR